MVASSQFLFRYDGSWKTVRRLVTGNISDRLADSLSIARKSVHRCDKKLDGRFRDGERAGRAFLATLDDTVIQR